MLTKTLQIILIVYLTVLQLNTTAQSGFQLVSSGNVDGLEKLLQDQPDWKNITSPTGWTLLHYTAMWVDKNREEIARTLITHEFDLNATTKDEGQTPLQLALKDRQAVLSQMLIEAGADLNMKDLKGKTTLEYALEFGNFEVLDMITSLEISIAYETHEDEIILHKATAIGYSTLVESLISNGTETGYITPTGQSLVHSAAIGGMPALAGDMIRSGMDPNLRDIYGQTALHLATKNGHNEVVSALISGKCDQNIENPLGQKAFHIALETGNDELIRLLDETSEWKFPNLDGLYPDDDLPGADPKIFAPGVISTQESFDFSISISPDGKKILYSTRTDGSIPNHIRYMEKVNGRWTPPAAAPFASEYFEAEANFISGSRKIIFTSDRPLPGTAVPRRNTWIVDYGTDITTAIPFDSGFSNQFIMYVTGTKHRLFYTDRGGIHYTNYENDKYQPAILMSKEINGQVRGAHPFIAPDESYLIFDSQGRIDAIGGSDFYISYRQDDSSWTQGENLGPGINSPSNEICPWVSPDGKYFFFGSHRFDQADIFWVRASFIRDTER